MIPENFERPETQYIKFDKEELKKIEAKERAKEYYQKNKEKILARQKAYAKRKYHEDEEYKKKRLANSQRYREKYPEKVREIRNLSQKKYYQKYKEYYKEYQKEYMKRYYKKLKEQQQRIDNAIKYIEEKGRLKYKPNELIKILKGEK